MSSLAALESLAPDYNVQQVPQLTVQQTTITQSTIEPIKVDCAPKKVDCAPKKVECPPKKEECPPKVDECKKPCDPCAKPAGYGWGWLGALILWFIIFTVLFWLIYYSLKPSFVLQTDSNQVDTAKVLLAAVISALILVIIIWLIKVAVSRR